MRKRPQGIAALMRAFNSYEFDRSRFGACGFPLHYAYGDQTEEVEAVRASVVARRFADVRIRRFKGVHHFVPPEQLYTAAYARMLVEHWRRAEESEP